MERIGVRELRQNASRYLARVSQGERLAVTDRGRPVALLIPIQADSWQSLIEQGRVIPAADRTSPADDAPLELSFSGSDRLAEMRDPER